MPQSFSAGGRARVMRPHCLNFSLASLESNGDDGNDKGVELDRLEVDGVSVGGMTGVDITGVLGGDTPVSDENDDELVRSKDQQR